MEWIKLESHQDKFDFMHTLVESADNAIDNSFYVNPLGEKHSKYHRNIGIGVSNYANWLAGCGMKFSDESARVYTHNLFEELSYFAIKASIELAKVKSRCGSFYQTKWAQGKFPHELSILPDEFRHQLRYNWEELRVDLLKYGIRNERLLAIAPTSTSGKCINATPGVDVPKQFKTIEEGTYSLPFVVPNLKSNREYYTTRFNTSNRDVIELAAIRQRFLCMSQSVSLAYSDPRSAHEVISNIIYAEQLGLKSLYYSHSQKMGETGEEGCESCGS